MNLNELNEQQEQAVLNSEGPSLVIAGAGSGKTKVLTYKIAKLIEDGVLPYHILAITFTNKAAKEMKERIVKMVGPKSYDATISTFHSFGARVLRNEIESLGYSRNFTIVDGNDQQAIVKTILKDLNIDSKKYTPRNLISKISKLKNEGISATEYDISAEGHYEEIIAKVYLKYSETLVSNNCVDFDDLLILPVKIFKENSDILNKYQELFKYILVDEYQDTNALQYELVRLIGEKYHNVFVVGDGDQSIYSWRGANVENILNFDKDYQGANVFLLEQNYRSTKTIISAANNLIKNNEFRKDKNLFTENEEGELINYIRANDESDEAFQIINEVVKLIRGGVSLSDIAILYRTNAQSRIFEEVLLKENIAYNIVGSYYFYARKEIKDILAYLRLIVNHNDDISFMRVVNAPKRGIGNTTIDKLREIAEGNGISLMEAIELNYLSSSANQKLHDFKNLIAELTEYEKEHSIAHVIEAVLNKSGYMLSISDSSVESTVRREYLEEFLSVANVFEETHEEISLSQFLEEISLVADMKLYDEETNKLTLMTLHAAKGLEFKYVFLVGLEEGILPHGNSSGSRDELEEERRLCYVGITRAKEKLFISNARTRMFLGARSMNLVSRFIKEIGYNLIEQDGEILEKPAFDEESLSDTSNNEFNAGDKVVHPMFGEGIVVSVDDTIINVAFSSPHNIKKISNLYNSLERI